MGKSELFSHFADRFEIKRTQAREIFEELTTLAEKELKRSGEFTLPNMVKLVVQKRKARMGCSSSALREATPAAEISHHRSSFAAWELTTRNRESGENLASLTVRS